VRIWTWLLFKATLWEEKDVDEDEIVLDYYALDLLPA
jgi:hypothetical protein